MGNNGEVTSEGFSLERLHQALGCVNHGDVPEREEPQ